MAQLPPRVPNIVAANWQEISPPKKMKSAITMEMEHTTVTSSDNSPSWVDEFLDFSTVKRGSHRRSMSDSVAFLEIPMAEECRRSSIPGGRSSSSSNCMLDEDDEQNLMSMFNVPSGGGPPLPVYCSNSSSPSNTTDQNNNNNNDDDQVVLHQLKSEPEDDQNSCKSEGHNVENSKDKIVDPKRIKRILANRQSAQRSRVRKLHYISELERVVTSLQAEVSVLSPRVAFLDHQRLVLGVDNSALKQRIAALGQDKIFKDAHQEALKREIERLNQVYYEQNVKNTEKSCPPDSKQQQPSPAINCSAEKEQLVI